MNDLSYDISDRYLIS